MRQLVKKLIPRPLVSLLSDTRKEVRTFKKLASGYGHFQTVRKWSCLDKSGSPTPWYTYAAIEFLSHLDFSKLNVLEYGSGNSSLWWVKRCAKLVAIENDSVWYEKIKTGINSSGKATYLLKTGEREYVEQSFLADSDIVIIDGAFRSKCADWLIESVRDKSNRVAMVVFDNADWYPKTMSALKESLHWVQVDFHGFGPINDYSWTTSVFINPERRDQIKHARQLASVCGLSSAGNDDDAPAT